MRIVGHMSTTPDDAAATPGPASPEASTPEASTPEQPSTGPTSVGEVIVGGEQPGERTLDGKEVAPLRDKYPTRGNGWIVLGVALFLVALMFAFADVRVSQRPTTITHEQVCGTWLDRQDPQDKDWIDACDDAHAQRTWLIAGPIVLGVASIAYGVSLRIRRRS